MGSSVVGNTLHIYMRQAGNYHGKTAVIRKARSPSVLRNHLIFAWWWWTTKGHCGNCKQRAPQAMASRVSCDGAWSSNGEVWWRGRGPSDKQSKRVMYIKACCVALRRWIMSPAACKLWLENNKSCWLTVVVCGEVGTPCHLGSRLHREASLA